MYPVVMYHIPNFFPVYFPTYFPSDFLLKKVEKRNFLTNIIGFSCCFLPFLAKIHWGNKLGNKQGKKLGRWYITTGYIKVWKSKSL